MSEVTEIRRDEKGRPIAEDGYPLGGLAKTDEIVAATGLGKSTIYAMIQSGELPSRAFGRRRCVPWATVRQMFFQTEEA